MFSLGWLHQPSSAALTRWVDEANPAYGLLRAAGVASTLLWLEGGGHSAPLAGFYQDKRGPEVLPAVERFVSAN